MTRLAASFLIPNGGFLVSMLVTLLVLAVVWIWPLVAVARRQQWGWFLGIIVLGPVAALVWLLLGRHNEPIGST